MSVTNPKLLDAVTMSADITSATFDISDYSGYAIHCIWTGTPTGTLYIKGSDDDSNYVVITSLALTGVADQLMYDPQIANYDYVRVYYTKTSSTGALTAYISVKNPTRTGV